MEKTKKPRVSEHLMFSSSAGKENSLYTSNNKVVCVLKVYSSGVIILGL